MKMPTTATLLLREESTVNLNQLVDKSLKKQPPLPVYNLDLKSAHLQLTLLTKSDDEGFESDIDSLSLVSNESETKTTETDSANGSSSSDDSDDPTEQTAAASANVETYNLVDCCCYTDSKFTDLLIFVIKNEALLFKFDNLDYLRNFYINFTALKAVANQKIYNNLQTKFNLLQRTDSNGITHIEITRQLPSTTIKKSTNNNNEILKYPSTENILESKQINLIKVWNSAEDLITAEQPRRPIRKKAKAPPPPTPIKQIPNTMSGQFVRVNVNLDLNHRMIIKSSVPPQPPPSLSSQHQKYNKELHPKKFGISQSSWTNSVPRLLLKQRKSPLDNRQNFTPMAYRYIDTTTMPRQQNNNYQPSMANRLFGLSPKLRDFSRSNNDNCSGWSVGEGINNAPNLKSLIKKENRKMNNKNDKKVTFSAYTTVQVV